MTLGASDFMPLDRQLFRRRIADALTDLIAQKHSTAKQAAKAYGIDPSTAENLRKGHLSVPTLEKVARTDGWAIWAALGEEIFGQTYEDHLQSLIEETRRAQENLARRRDHVRQLEARAFGMDDVGDRLDA